MTVGSVSCDGVAARSEFAVSSGNAPRADESGEEEFSAFVRSAIDRPSADDPLQKKFLVIMQGPIMLRGCMEKRILCMSSARSKA
jgi:hypothetical protein